MSEKTLTIDEIVAINKMLAKEFIESRLDIVPSNRNIERLAGCITELECQAYQTEYQAQHA